MNKKMKVLFSVLSLLMVLSLSTCIVSAADGDVLDTWEGDSLTSKPNGDDKGGIRDKEKGVIHLGSEDSTAAEGHAMWGYEPNPYDTAKGTRSYTCVIKVKIVEAGDDSDENVLRVDPKIRPQDGTPEPEDQGDYYTGERLSNLVPAKDGYIYLYSVIEPNEYEEAASIKVENRVWFTMNTGWVIDVYACTVYEGDLSKTYEEMCKPEPTPTPEVTPTPEPTPTPEATEKSIAQSTVNPTVNPTVTPAENGTSNQNDGFPGWIIAVIVLAVVVAVVVVIVVMQKKKK